jgi:DNA-binding transcriptional MerR regulator
LKVYRLGMAGYRISQAARLAGFAPSALRFYESEGLLPEPSRTPAGHRVYDESDVERLRFVHRARQLGLALEEILDLVAAWDVGVCAPVQHGLATGIANRRREIGARIAELKVLAGQLGAAEQAVTGASGVGACGPGCACLAASTDLASSDGQTPGTTGSRLIELTPRTGAFSNPGPHPWSGRSC